MIELTCIVCPKGCRLRVDENDGYKVTGNACPRGAAYGREEALDPKRVVTSTVRILFERDAESVDSVRPDLPAPLPLVSYFDPDLPHIEARLPVKTSVPIPKAKIADVMNAVHAVTVRGPYDIGDVIIKNVAETGADLIATRDLRVPDA
ncbi:MAG: DUF1667 domain-containing protein [Clostridiales bacterium]|nr:DUF1667 domain-containing protein [Clostridiales bacterium]